MYINAKGRLIDLNRPKVMGIINVTDDSFYSGSRHLSDDDVVSVAVKMMEEGADFIDIGGCSTRPGSRPVPLEIEKERVCRASELILRRCPEAILSVDTYRSEVAMEAVVNSGVSIINDISGGEMDAGMFPLVVRLNIPYVMMHMQGTPENMQKDPHYEDVVADILTWFGQRITVLQEAGMKDIILDPGFGFGKTIDHNFEMLRRLNEFHIAGLPLLVGLSRKSLVWRSLNVTPDQALTGTTALHMTALMNGASILRVHDVKEAKEVITMYEKIYPQNLLFDQYC